MRGLQVTDPGSLLWRKYLSFALTGFSGYAMIRQIFSRVDSIKMKNQSLYVAMIFTVAMAIIPMSASAATEIVV